MLSDVSVGDPATAADAAVGAPGTSCEVGDLAHLRESFPDGWSPAAVDVALEQLATQTVERRVYSIGTGAVVCDQPAERTEVGVAQDGTILWMIPVLGRTALELPPSVTPAGVDEEAAPVANPS